MMPQSQFSVIAEVVPERIADLRTLLLSMNDSPGVASPHNPLVPFGAFPELHFARIVILDDPTLSDFADAGAPIPDFAVLVALMGDCDGSSDRMLAELAQRAEYGLRKIFSCCHGFAPDTDLLSWMHRHSERAAANYVNWIGRTVQQVVEEARLRTELVTFVAAHQLELERGEPQQVRARLTAHVRELIDAGSLTLSAPPRTPLGWRVRSALHFAIVPAALLSPWLITIPLGVDQTARFAWTVAGSVVFGALLLLVLIRSFPATLAVVIVCGAWLVPLLVLVPVLIVPALALGVSFLAVLRHYEKTEPEVIHRPTVDHVLRLAALEDHDITNQYTALGSVKPSRFRRALFPILLWIIDYFARHVYGRGHLGRIRTIHFARWIFLDGKRRMVFASNYDGSHEAYMDDFINKAGWGINLAFTCGLGYPRTRWIIKDGIDDELKFKYTQRRHQVPTETWYRAYPSLTVFDLERNSRVRAGFQRNAMTDAQVRVWLRDL